jgi:4-hydroxy-4-methyl-2-oxoglutarate aldolase
MPTETIGTINHPIVIGGELVRPGDLVFGDDDGVCIVRAEEAAMMEGSRRGEPMDISARQAVMKARGATWD